MQAALAYLAQIVALIRKEFRDLFKDPSSRALLLMPAILQSLLFGYGATYDLTHVPYAVLDQSRGAASTELLASLDGGGVFTRVATLDNAGQIAAVIDSGDALLVLGIPPDFEARLATDRQAPLQVILDGRNSATAGAASAQIASVVAAFNVARGAVPLVTIDRRAWFNPNLESRWNLMPPLIAALSMIQTLLLSALSVAREREQGTFDQLLVTPLTPLQILIGKALPTMTVGILQSTLIFLIILFWFGIPMVGSVWLLYLGLASFTLASVGIGLSISAVALTMQQAMLYTFLIVMPLMLLSGLLTPIRNMPQVLQWVTYANPLRFGVDLVRRVYLEGAGLAEVGADFVPLLCVAATTLPLAAWLFRHRLS
ncbi:ABC transporter permease [Alloyangia pacifica]|uniref:Transport permease protein n=1 Tax=Alloyangia pacifica TaxID=311180 RepID=A0A1I6QYD1_9RHOB|nr:ABC transporter permease [Alloyangia pacifica]SDG05552.1 ABC-2 type transport system permease protein [Alloyangia pacifica]SFS57497.1 ABC-2 type transport system permease protein [Alloyangia pacifica]